MGLSTQWHGCQGYIRGSAPNGMGARAPYGAQQPMAWVRDLCKGLSTPLNGCQGLNTLLHMCQGTIWG